jgi:23S rRNA (guanine745-N1)-methyltransferase
MNFTSHPALRCPLDHQPLLQHGASLQCPEGHNFDIARQGYVNLLSAQDKRSKDPGDSKAMIAARREFLGAGYYQHLANAVCQTLEPLLTDDATLVDAGCGEGYYLQQLEQHLGAQSRPVPALIGFDISKWAVQSAARAQAVTWLVASNRHIPLADRSADVVLSLFGFPRYDSFRRILKPGGRLLVVEAGPQHLIELRQVIYATVKVPASPDQGAAEQAGLRATTRQSLKFTTPTLGSAAIGQLLTMTPHLYRASSDGKVRAAALEQLQLTVDVVVKVLQCD